MNCRTWTIAKDNNHVEDKVSRVTRSKAIGGLSLKNKHEQQPFTRLKPEASKLGPSNAKSKRVPLMSVDLCEQSIQLTHLVQPKVSAGFTIFSDQSEPCSSAQDNSTENKLIVDENENSLDHTDNITITTIRNQSVFERKRSLSKSQQSPSASKISSPCLDDKENIAPSYSESQHYEQLQVFNVLHAVPTQPAGLVSSSNQHSSISFNLSSSSSENISDSFLFDNSTIVSPDHIVIDCNEPTTNGGGMDDAASIESDSECGIEMALSDVFHDDEPSSVYQTAPSSFIGGNAVFPRASTVALEARIEEGFGCPEYADDIYAYLRECEIKSAPKAHYLQKQPDITGEMRLILIDWLIEVCVDFKFTDETLHLAVNYTDQFLSFMSVTRGKLQLVGTAALLIAAKFEEINLPETDEFVYITDNSYSKRQLLRMEQLVLDNLKFNASPPTKLNFLTWFLKLCKAERDTKCLAKYLCELSLLDAEYMRFKHSQVAAASVYLANVSFGITEPWNSQLQEKTGMCVESFKKIADKLLESMKNSSSLQYKNVLIKYETDSRFRVAEKEAPACLPRHEVYNFS